MAHDVGARTADPSKCGGCWEDRSLEERERVTDMFETLEKDQKRRVLSLIGFATLPNICETCLQRLVADDQESEARMQFENDAIRFEAAQARATEKKIAATLSSILPKYEKILRDYKSTKRGAKSLKRDRIHLLLKAGILTEWEQFPDVYYAFSYGEFIARVVDASVGYIEVVVRKWRRDAKNQLKEGISS